MYVALLDIMVNINSCQQYTYMLSLN